MLLHFLVVFLFSCIAVLIVPFVKVYTNGLTDADYIQPVFAAVLTLAYAVRCLRTPYNILILAGGHYKQTQTCHIVAAVLNIVISVAAVWLWGLVGIAIGTLVALTYQTLWMMIYNSKNLLKWPLRKIIKQLLVDTLTAVIILVSTCWVELHTVSYWGWFRMAVPVALIAFAVTVIMAMLFYGSHMKGIVRSLKK
jgi:O-antigen/teichoic acid export membrane protein